MTYQLITLETVRLMQISDLYYSVLSKITEDNQSHWELNAEMKIKKIQDHTSGNISVKINHKTHNYNEFEV